MVFIWYAGRLTFMMLCGRFQTLAFLVFLAFNLLIVASEQTSDEDLPQCPPGSQTKTSAADDGEDGDDDHQSPCVAALALEPTDGEEPVLPSTDDVASTDGTLIMHVNICWIYLHLFVS